MQQFEKLEHGNYYHIYNHGVGNKDLFRDANNYEYFLGLYEKYISPVAETYAWVLMKNHFHVLVRIKEEAEVVASFTPDRVLHPTGFENLSGVKPLHQHFSNLFNAYTKAYNKYHQIRDALFERPFKRKLIDSYEYLRQVILYIHNNPIHHGFCSHPLEYPWSSYLSCTSEKTTKLKRNEVLNWFDNKKNFEARHTKTDIDMDKMDWDMGI